ncbi:hypothetical protein [Croceimicrobium sp.]|uniref:hypothetical protein n=1 Tax=Croceimicrobium sp. TaxID=2828340 RepID=UPI003BA88B38
MKEYRYSDEKALQLIQKISRTTLPIIMIMILGALLLIDIYKGDTNPDELFFTHTIMFFTLIIVWILVYKNAHKYGSRLMQQYYFSVSDTGIEKIGPKGKMESMNFAQISSISIHKKGLLLESSKSKLLLPNGLEGFDELCNLISEKRSFKIT